MLAKYMKESTASAILRLPPSHAQLVIDLPGTFSVLRCCNKHKKNHRMKQANCAILPSVSVFLKHHILVEESEIKFNVSACLLCHHSITRIQHRDSPTPNVYKGINHTLSIHRKSDIRSLCVGNPMRYELISILKFLRLDGESCISIFIKSIIT